MKTPDTINGKTPEEIKKGLECKIRMRSHSCDCKCYQCDIFVPAYLNEERWSDARAYIQQLESRLAQAVRERDELFMYLPHDCTTCRFELTCERSDECNCDELWKWRGVCPANTKEEE